MKKLIFTVFAVSILITTYGQNTKKFLKEGNNHLEYEHYRKAANDYKLVLKDEPNNAEALFNLGRAYLCSYRHPEALEAMEKAIAINPTIDKHQDYWLGKVYQLNYKFDLAIEHYNKYLSTMSKSDARYADIQKFVEECGYAKEFVGKKSYYRIDNVGMPINTATDEHSPIITQDGSTMMFTSRKYTEDGESEDGNFSEEVLVSKKDDKGKWGKPISFTHNLDGHDATVQIYDNDTKLILYRNTGSGDLYTSELKNGVWSDPKPIDGINTLWPEIDAYVNKMGDKMIYSSNFKAENHDNSDLFMVTKTASGGWSEPVSLGENINTKYDEISPFISSDGKTLFFSSNGHNSMGGFDVFKSTYDENTKSWSKPENLGYPLNTPSDDIYFYYSNEDNWSGYFSSYRRDGLGEKDIYKVQFIPNVTISGIVKDVNTGEFVNGVSVQFIAEGQENEVVSSLSKENGKYLVNVLAGQSYSVLVQSKVGAILGTFEYVVPFLKEKDPLDYVFDIEINRASPELITENVSSALVEDEIPVSIDTEEFEEEDAMPVDESEVEAETFEEDEQEQETAIVENKSTETPAKPIANSYVPQTKGETTTVSETSVKEAKQHFKMDAVESGCKRVLHHVYFEFNQTKLKESSYDELDKLACLMSSKSDVKVEIGGYTDSVGNDLYNKLLSQKRAEAVVDYLMKQGIPKSRLTAVGYGEEQPIASNDDEADGRELNRRTEFKILEK